MISDILYKISIGELISEDEQREMKTWFDNLQNAPEQLSSMFKGLPTISTLSQITSALGTVNRGNFLSGDDGDYLDTTGNNPYTGVGMISPGLTVGSDQAAIFGMNAGDLQFWLSALTGKVYAGNGAVVLDEDGISIPSAGDAIEFYDSNFSRYVNLSMETSGDALNSYLKIQTYRVSNETNLISNGNFETGSFSSWTETDTGGLLSVVNSGYNGGYCAKIVSGTPAPTLAQTLSATPTTGIVIKAKVKGEIYLTASAGSFSGEIFSNTTDWRNVTLLLYCTSASFSLQFSTNTTGYLDDLTVRQLTSMVNVTNPYVQFQDYGTTIADYFYGERLVATKYASVGNIMLSETAYAISGTNNNYNLKLSGSSYPVPTKIRFAPTADSTITGIDSSGGYMDDATFFFYNDDDVYSITLSDENASSSAANRFSIGIDYVIRPRSGCIVAYNFALSRWVLFNPRKPRAETNANDIFRCDNPGGTSAFVGTIATLPGGATLTYNVTSGNEGAMVPTSTSQLGKMRLYNTTRGTSALISNCVTGTNTITLTANVPAGWQTTDVITIASQTVTAGGNWVDLEATSGITGKSSIFFMISVFGTSGDFVNIHPYETYAASKVDGYGAITGTWVRNLFLYPLISNVISLSWTGTPTSIVLRESGYFE